MAKVKKTKRSQAKKQSKQQPTLFMLLLVSIVVVILAKSIGFHMIKEPVRKRKATVHVAKFFCGDDKSISATFYPDTDTKVDLALSDGRMLSLPHVISGSGARYANADESTVFWNKGNTAFMTEGAVTTYDNCVTQE